MAAPGRGGEGALSRCGERGARLAEAIRHGEFSHLAALRPVPLLSSVLVNLQPAFVGISLGTQRVAAALGIVPAAAVVSLGGAGLGRAF